MTSVDFTTILTESPTFRFISSALVRVITLSSRLSPTRTKTWAMMSPSFSASIRPLSLLRAESAIVSLIQLSRKMTAPTIPPGHPGSPGHPHVGVRMHALQSLYELGQRDVEALDLVLLQESGLISRRLFR